MQYTIYRRRDEFVINSGKKEISELLERHVPEGSRVIAGVYERWISEMSGNVAALINVNGTKYVVIAYHNDIDWIESEFQLIPFKKKTIKDLDFSYFETENAVEDFLDAIKNK